MADAPAPHVQIASLPLAVVLLSPGQRIAAANPAAEQFFGQSFRRLAGRALHQALRFTEAPLAERLGDGEAMLSARDVKATVVGQGERRLDVTLGPVIDAPGWQMLTLHDGSTAEAMGEDTGAGDSAVLRAPEVLAHEIKNPLAGIRGAAQLLARKVGAKERALTTLIADEVDRIAHLIDEMQTLSRRTPAPVGPCNLHEVIRRGSAVIAAARSAGPGIEEEFDPSLPLVLGSADSLVQVVINLLSNAREACRDRPKARILVRTRFASGLTLHAVGVGKRVALPIELRISDNGPGVEPGLREHIFEPFVTTKKTGQGLGLALVRKLVRDMNGRITHERDESGGWTHFRLHLPLAQDAGARRTE
ncbi:MAG: PAS domain-containing sensor histidine kinase [Novosphingobium sp.]|nr:PAS domain-containing sensor histidine kinase [Novosphingobium sp.]